GDAPSNDSADDYNERKRRMQFYLRSALKPALPPKKESGPFGEDTTAARPNAPVPGFDVRPNLKPARVNAPTDAPNIFQPGTGPVLQLLGMRNILGGGTAKSPLAKPGNAGDISGLNAPLPQLVRPNTMLLRSDFQAKPELSKW